MCLSVNISDSTEGVGEKYYNDANNETGGDEATQHYIISKLIKIRLSYLSLLGFATTFQVFPVLSPSIVSMQRDFVSTEFW